VPPLELSTVARLLFQGAVANTSLISARAAVSAQLVIAKFEGARVWQFWTHGRFDQSDVMRSGLQLAGQAHDLFEIFDIVSFTPLYVILGNAEELNLGDGRVRRVLFERHPLERTVRWRTVANEISMGLVVRRCFQCSAGKS
jgi:hypothetical protein